MTTPSLGEAALLTGGRIGRYFGIVTMVPTLFVVLWAYALMSAEAWLGRPNLEVMRVRLGDWSLTEVAWILLATLVLSLFLHPLQFATVQLLEGYWGASRIGLGAMRWRVRHHRGRVLDRRGRALDHSDAVDVAFEEWPKFSHTWEDPVWGVKQEEFLDSAASNDVLPNIVARDAIERWGARYPAVHRIMPTRLGNALRRYEDSAGQRYGMDAIVVAPHLSLVVPDAHLGYLRDSRQLLDTTVRLSFVSLFATLLTVSALLSDGLWLLVALAPYGLAYLAYRAAITAADEYGTAVATIIDLNRFAFYDGLGVPRPRDTTEERENNRRLMRLLKGDEGIVVRYEQVTEALPSLPRRKLRSTTRPRGRKPADPRP